MGLDKYILKVLCDRFVVDKLSCVKLDGKYLYYEKVNYESLHTFKHKDDSIFDLYQTNVVDYVYDMYRKFRIRPGKDTTKMLVEYCQNELKDKHKLRVKNDKLGGIITSMTNGSKTIVNWLSTKK